MNKFKKSQVLLLFVLVLLLLITPFLPSSLRPTYLYFLFNFLIISLGAEAGLLSAFSRPSEDKKQSASVTQKPAIAIPEKWEASTSTGGISVSEVSENMPKVVEKSASEKVKVVGVTKVGKVKKCPSIPSLFVVGGGEADDAETMDEKELEPEDEVGGISGQELFAKAEAFIGNFYKQLKMQRG